MTTLPHPLLSHAHDSFGITDIHSALVESMRVTMFSLFWLAALPFAAIFSLATAVFDKLLFLRSTAFRLPYLRNPFAIQPLLLRRSGCSKGTVGTHHRSTSDRNRINPPAAI